MGKYRITAEVELTAIDEIDFELTDGIYPMPIKVSYPAACARIRRKMT